MWNEFVHLCVIFWEISLSHLFEGWPRPSGRSCDVNMLAHIRRARFIPLCVFADSVCLNRLVGGFFGGVVENILQHVLLDSCLLFVCLSMLGSFCVKC